jgi:hypothetical protein
METGRTLIPSVSRNFRVAKRPHLARKRELGQRRGTNAGFGANTGRKSAHWAHPQ